MPKNKKQAAAPTSVWDLIMGPGKLIKFLTTLSRQTTALILAVVALLAAIGTLVTKVRSDPLPTAILFLLMLGSLSAAFVVRHRHQHSDGQPAEPSAIRGLQPFDEGEGALLESRKSETVSLLTKLGSAEFRFGLLVGDANVGKSSLLRAGVMSEVRKSGTTVVDISHFGSSADTLSEKLIAELRRVVETAPNTGVKELIGQIVGTSTMRVLIVCDDFDDMYLALDDEVERARAIDVLTPVVNANGQVSFLAVVDTQFRQKVRSDFGRVCGRTPDFEFEVGRLPTETALETLKRFSQHDVKLGLRPLSNSLCERIAQGLTHEGSVCPAELQIVADRLRAAKKEQWQNLSAHPLVERVLIEFVKEQLSATSDPAGWARRALELLTRKQAAGTPSEVTSLTFDEIAAQIGGGAGDQAQGLRVALGGLVESDLVMRIPDNKYSLHHAYMSGIARDALEGCNVQPSISEMLRSIAPKAALVGATATAIVAGGVLIISGLSRGPYQSNLLSKTGVTTLVWNEVLVDPTDEFVAATAAGNRLALWNLNLPASTGSAASPCDGNPAVLSLPSSDAATGKTLSGLVLGVGQFNPDGTHIHAIGTSIVSNQLWVMTWNVSAPCDQPTQLWGSFVHHLDDGTACSAVDMAFNEYLQMVAVAYNAPSDDLTKTDCNRVSMLSVGPGSQAAPVLGQDRRDSNHGDGLSSLSRQTKYSPRKLVFGPNRDRLLVLTASDSEQLFETLNSQLVPQGTPQSVRYGTPYRVLVDHDHTDIVLEEDAGPFWLRPPATWFSVSGGLWVANWDSDVNQLRSWLGGLSRNDPPPVGVSADGKLLVELSDTEAFPVFEMDNRAGPIHLPTPPLPFFDG